MLTSILLSLLTLNTADAVPLQLTQQGRVLDNNGASVTGAHDLTFRIYDASTGGSVYWSETLTVNFSNGYYAAILGTDEQNNPLDSSTLSLYPLYLEVQLDNNAPMTTRYSINSAPYAQMAGNAEVASSVDGGSVNATEVSINASQVIDGNGNWVGQPITVDWNNIDPNTIPSYIADGDDNTQLSEAEVETYITNGPINLSSGSQVGGSDIVTVATDSDTLAGLSCSSGEIAGWSGATWTCVSDNTLTQSELTTMLSNSPVDLNAGSTIGGLAILTEADDSDTLANLSCANDGEIARYDLVLDDWYCDADTVLDQAGVLAHVNGEALSLASGTQVDGSDVITVATLGNHMSSSGTSISTTQVTLAQNQEHTITPSGTDYMTQVEYLDPSENIWLPIPKTSTSGICTVCGDGSDGDYLAFPIDSPTPINVTLQSGTYNYSSFTIPTNVIVDVLGTEPLIINVTGKAEIRGQLNLSGDDAQCSYGGPCPGGVGGPGGADGSSGGMGSQVPSTAGVSMDWDRTDLYFGSDFQGGTGGSGNNGRYHNSWYTQCNHYGAAGGGGGGAVKIAAQSIEINITDGINVSGGSSVRDTNVWDSACGSQGSGGSGNGGSVWLIGGKVDLASDALNISGGTDGSVRIDNSNRINYSGSFYRVTASNTISDFAYYTTSAGVITIKNNVFDSVDIRATLVQN